MLYDLTHQIDANLPVYPGDPRVKIEQVGVFERDGYRDCLVTMGNHNGTHIDAPQHMLKEGKALSDYPPERFVTKAICVDAGNGFDAAKIAPQITEPNLGVLFYTGASQRFYEESYWHQYAVLDDATIQVLIDKKVSIIGIDTGSFDIADDFPVHKTLLGADILLIENLTNLEPLVGKAFELYALSLKLEADGAPARVIAKLS